MIFIRTASGLRFDLINPTPDMVRIEDVAHALGGLNRFTGHGHMFYSVAEHSISVANFVAREGGSPEVVRQALLHDATEAYCGDVSSPAKRAMRALDGGLSAYDILERRIWEHAIVPAFGLPVDLHPLVHRADRALADIEGTALLPDWTPRVQSVWSNPDAPVGLDSAQAARAFLRAFQVTTSRLERLAA